MADWIGEAELQGVGCDLMVVQLEHGHSGDKVDVGFEAEVPLLGLELQLCLLVLRGDGRRDRIGAAGVFKHVQLLVDFGRE